MIISERLSVRFPEQRRSSRAASNKYEKRSEQFKYVGHQDRLFATIASPHLPAAFALARWLSGSRTDAEDITQEACLRAFRSLQTFRGDNPRAWMLRITRNTAMTWLWKHRSVKVVSIDELNDDALQKISLDGTSTQEAKLIEAAEAASLEAAIASLPEAFREVVVLRDIQGLSYHEIAEVTGDALGTVMSRLSRGRGKLVRSISERKGR